MAVVTDGSAVLGLGNLGPAAALPVMEGKVMLFRGWPALMPGPSALAHRILKTSSASFVVSRQVQASTSKISVRHAVSKSNGHSRHPSTFP